MTNPTFEVTLADHGYPHSRLERNILTVDGGELIDTRGVPQATLRLTTT